MKLFKSLLKCVFRTNLSPIIWACVLIFFVTGCKLSDPTDYSSVYRIKGNEHTEISFYMFHFNDTLSFLYYQLNVSDQPDNGDTILNLTIDYKIVPVNDARQIADSSSKTLRIGKGAVQADYFPIKFLKNGIYHIFVNAVDLNGDLICNEKSEFAKSDNPDKNDFMVIDDHNHVVHNSNVQEGENFNVVAGGRFNLNGDFCLIKPENSLPKPPYFISDDQDSLIKISELSNGRMKDTTTVNTVENQLLCYKLSDTNSLIPLVFIANSAFPFVNAVESKISTLRYILAANEYDYIQDSEFKEKALNDFWKMAGGNDARAMTIKKSYYDRVSNANKLFTSYKYGWRSDRGMVYIVLGNPDRVYRERGIETWIYYGLDDGNDLVFDFRMKEIYPGIIDLFLERDIRYKNSWMKRVEALRK